MTSKFKINDINRVRRGDTIITKHGHEYLVVKVNKKVNHDMYGNEITPTVDSISVSAPETLDDGDLIVSRHLVLTNFKHALRDAPTEPRDYGEYVCMADGTHWLKTPDYEYGDIWAQLEPTDNGHNTISAAHEWADIVDLLGEKAATMKRVGQ